MNLPSSSFLARSLDKDVLAENTHENRKRRTASTGNLSLYEDGDEDLNDDLDHNTDLPTPVAIDFSELAFLLEGTESQGHTTDELVANSAADFVTMVANNPQVWFDVLSRTPTLIKERKAKRDRMNGDILRYSHENKRLRNERDNALDERDEALVERDEARQAIRNDKAPTTFIPNAGPTPAHVALQQEFEGYKRLAQDTVDSRNNDYYDLERDLLKVQNELYEAQNDLDAADDDFEQQKQVIENLTNERDQAVHNLQQQGESQTQPHASLFGARPAAQRLNALRQDRERSQSRQPAERVREPAPRPQTDERAPRPSVAPSAALSSLSARPTVRFPDPDIFKGDDTAKYRMWRSKMTAKIRSSYGNDSDFRTVMDYVHSRTDGQAWQIIENHSEFSRSPWTSIEQCWEELDNNYMSKDEEAKAEIEYALCKQSHGESYIKWMITLRDLAARSGKELKARDVWMKLNEVYQKKTIQLTTKTFTEFDAFCVIEENAYEAMKSMRGATKTSNTESGTGRGRGRGANNTPGTSGTPSNRSGGSRGGSGRGEVARYLPNKYSNLPKKTDPGVTERIFKNNLCFACREPGHSAGAKQCPFNTERGKYAFADVPREMTKAQYETFQHGRGTALNAMDDYENNALPESEEQLRIQSAPHQQGNGSLHQ